jgi:hypothetical protein
MASDPVEIFGEEQLAYMLSHIDDTRAPVIITVCTLGLVLSPLFVVLRIWSRKISFGYFKLDLSDWLCIGSLVRLAYLHQADATFDKDSSPSHF